MIYPFFIVGGMWFWVLLVIDFMLLVYFVEDDSAGFAFVTVVVLFACLMFLGDFNVLSWLRENPKQFGYYLIMYIPAGIVYSIVKYLMFLTDIRRKITKTISEYLDRVKVEKEDDLSVAQKGELAKKLNYHNISFSESTRRVVFWMTYWPWSAFWTILNNPLRWLYEEVAELLKKSFKGMYTKILGNQFSKIDEWEKQYEDEKYNQKDDDFPNQYR